MTIHLLNSAMMPQPGSYSLVTVNADAWRIAFEAAREQGADFKSYIGYPQTAAHISAVLGVAVEVSREQTSLETGDMLFICRLPYRPADPATKGQAVVEEFEYSMATYSQPKSA